MSIHLHVHHHITHNIQNKIQETNQWMNKSQPPSSPSTGHHICISESCISRLNNWSSILCFLRLFLWSWLWFFCSAQCLDFDFNILVGFTGIHFLMVELHNNAGDIVRTTTSEGSLCQFPGSCPWLFFCLGYRNSILKNDVSPTAVSSISTVYNHPFSCHSTASNVIFKLSFD